MRTECGFIGPVGEHQVVGRLAQAEEMFGRILELATEDQTAWIAAASAGMGTVLRIRGDLDRAEEMQQKALNLNAELGHTEGTANAYYNLGIVYERREETRRAEEAYLKALALYSELGSRANTARAYSNLGLVYEARGDLARAQETWTAALALLEQSDSPLSAAEKESVEWLRELTRREEGL